MIEFSPTVLNKAQRLVRKHRVRQIVGYQVQGDNGVYTVLTDADPVTKKATWISCTCPADAYSNVSPCSHAAAVLLTVMEGTPVPVDEIADYVSLEVVE